VEVGLIDAGLGAYLIYPFAPWFCPCVRTVIVYWTCAFA